MDRHSGIWDTALLDSHWNSKIHEFLGMERQRATGQSWEWSKGEEGESAF